MSWRRGELTKGGDEDAKRAESLSSKRLEAPAAIFTVAGAEAWAAPQIPLATRLGSAARDVQAGEQAGGSAAASGRLLVSRASAGGRWRRLATMESPPNGRRPAEETRPLPPWKPPACRRRRRLLWLKAGDEETGAPLSSSNSQRPYRLASPTDSETARGFHASQQR